MSIQVIMYCTEWCPDCTRARRYFKRREIEFKEIDIDRVPGAEEEMRAKNGNTGKIPTMIIGNEVLVEPTSLELDAIFDQLEAR